MSSPLISNFDKGSITEAYQNLEGCLYDDQTIQLDEVKGGNTYHIILDHDGAHEPKIQKIYLVGTKLLLLCQESTKPCHCLNIEDGEFTFNVEVGHADPDSLDLITYVYNARKNEISDDGIHYVTSEGVYLHRILSEQKSLKDSQWDWPWNWNLCGFFNDARV